MQNDLDEHYPLYDVIIKLQTSCTQDEAVAIMLGMIDGPPTLISVNHDCNYHDSEEKEDYGYLLDQHLEVWRSSLTEDYFRAKKDKLTEEVVAEKLAAIKEFDIDYVNKARTYLCHINDELTKGAMSELRLTSANGGSRITLKSLDEWASKEYGISIFKNLESNTVSAMPPKNSQHEAEFDGKGRMTKKAVDSLYTTFGFLVETFADQQKDIYCLPDGRVNASAIANHLCDLAFVANEYGEGQKFESIKKRIFASMSKRKAF
jgi:hypothetical protein